MSCRADAQSSWQSPEGRVWLEEAVGSSVHLAAQQPTCLGAHGQQVGDQSSCRRARWRGGEIGMQGLCWLWWGGTWTQSCHLLATGLQAKLRWELSQELCHCAGRNAQLSATEIAHGKGAWLRALSEVLPWEAPFQLLPSTKPTGSFEVRNPKLALCYWRGIFVQNWS